MFKNVYIIVVFLLSGSYNNAHSEQIAICDFGKTGYRYCTSEGALCKITNNSNNYTCYCAEGKVKVNGYCTDTCEQKKGENTWNEYCEEKGATCEMEQTGPNCKCKDENIFDEDEEKCTYIAVTKVPTEIMKSTQKPDIQSVATQNLSTTISTMDFSVISHMIENDTSFTFVDNVTSTTTSTADNDKCKEGKEGYQICSKMNAICKTYKRKYFCYCRLGYKPNNGICQDVDECLESNACSMNATCINLRGTFTCICGTGYFQVVEEDICINKCKSSKCKKYCNKTALSIQCQKISEDDVSSKKEGELSNNSSEIILMSFTILFGLLFIISTGMALYFYKRGQKCQKNVKYCSDQQLITIEESVSKSEEKINPQEGMVVVSYIFPNKNIGKKYFKN